MIKCPDCTYKAMTPGSLGGHRAMAHGTIPAEPPVAPSGPKSADPRPLAPAAQRPSAGTEVVYRDVYTVPLTREAWLMAAIGKLRPLFIEAGSPIPDLIRVSVGWPGGRGKKTGVIGQCWPTALAQDNVHAIFLSPVLQEPIETLGTLVHELAHAAAPKGASHRGPFVKVAKAVGLTAPWTGTGESAELVMKLKAVAADLGPFDHAKLTTLGRQHVQTTRMIKVECVDCGCVVRMARTWIEIAGVPRCGCGGGMEVAA